MLETSGIFNWFKNKPMNSKVKNSFTNDMKTPGPPNSKKIFNIWHIFVYLTKAN